MHALGFSAAHGREHLLAELIGVGMEPACGLPPLAGGFRAQRRVAAEEVLAGAVELTLQVFQPGRDLRELGVGQEMADTAEERERRGFD